MESISDVMSRDHKKIEDILSEFKNNIGGQEELQSFNNFRWELEGHLFLEERAIFTFLRSKKSRLYEDIPKIEEEHDRLLDLLNKIGEDLKNQKNADAMENQKELEALLIKHKEFEDTVLYPKLDESLNEEQKGIVIKRIERFSSEKVTA
ncbi:MAG: hemerythrin domain-containing protein [archaeon]|nr:MAG: hemerythrin domain-containing protein [archaeon]